MNTHANQLNAQQSAGNEARSYTIEINHVSKSFKHEHVLQDVNLTFTDNHIYGFVGRNGSGKTVFFKMLCGFILPDAGTIRVDGKIIGKDIDFPEDLGALIETPGFIWYQSAFANLYYLAKIRNKIGKAQVQEAIRQVGLDPDSRKWVGQYSLGMKQRLGIAQAFMEDPKLLILDEPMNGLDERGVQEIRQLILSFKRPGRIVLLTSHHREDIEMLCDQVYHVQDGTFELQS